GQRAGLPIQGKRSHPREEENSIVSSGRPIGSRCYIPVAGVPSAFGTRANQQSLKEHSKAVLGRRLSFGRIYLCHPSNFDSPPSSASASVPARDNRQANDSR